MENPGGMPPGEVTRLLEAAEAGDPEALDRLVPLVYEDLRRVAHRQLDREGGGHTLQTTALIHEAYLKLAGAAPSAPPAARTSSPSPPGRCARFWWTTPAGERRRNEAAA